MGKLGFDEIFVGAGGGYQGIYIPVHTNLSSVVMFIMGK